MTCPKCRSKKAGYRVVDSRDGKRQRYRRLECKRCLHRWSTYELPVNVLNEMRRIRSLQAELSLRYKALESCLSSLDPNI
jgi:predicted Zn finger-like uncharacterized protein